MTVLIFYLTTMTLQRLSHGLVIIKSVKLLNYLNPKNTDTKKKKSSTVKKNQRKLLV